MFTNGNSTFKPPTLRIPVLSENKNEFKKWRQEIRAYLNLYDQSDKILMEEELEPVAKTPEDYLDANGNLIDNYDQIKVMDDLQFGKAMATFKDKSRFISTVLIQACMENKKASNLIQNVIPGDWLSIWRILQKYYHPMGAINKVELFRKFSAMKKEKHESIMEFVQRVDSELTDLRLYGVEIPDEISISVLQQGAGTEYDLFIRMLIHQKSTYEVIKDELINYDFHSTATLSTSKIESTDQSKVQQVQFSQQSQNTTNSNNKRQKRRWKSFGPKAKFNKELSTPRNSNARNTNNIQRTRCTFCNKLGHHYNECRSRLGTNQPRNQYQKNVMRCARCYRVGHTIANCRANTKVMTVAITDSENKDVKSDSSANSKNDSSIYRLLMFKDCSEDVQINSTHNSDLGLSESEEYDSNDQILLDSGANRHVFNTESYFSSIEYLLEPRMFVSANNEYTEVYQIGEVLWLKDVLFVPNAHSNIMSLSCLQAAGFGARLVHGGMEILLPGGHRLLTASLVNGLYIISWNDMLKAKDTILDYWNVHKFAEPPNIDVSTVMLSMHETIELLHKRLGHVSMKRIKHLVDSGYLNSEITLSQYKDHVCDSCMRCKSTRSSFTQQFPVCNFPLERIHMDVQGPFRVPSLSGNNYIVGFIDAYSRMSFTYYVKNKSDVYDVLVNEFYPHVIEYVKNSNIPTASTPITIISDNGEFKSQRVKSFLSSHGIRQMFTCPYTPEHNGLIERLWRTLHTMASTMMNEKRVKPDLWEEAHRTANYLYNRIPPTTVTSHGLISPYQLFYNGSPPTLSHIRMFGSKAFVHKSKSELKKTFDPKAYEGILVGYDDEHIKSYRIYIPHTNVLMITTHVTIDEEYRKLNDMYPFTNPHMTTSLNENDIPVRTDSISHYEYLVGTTHKDDEDGMLYQTTRVVEENDLIVVYRRNIHKNGRLSVKEDGPIHVRDVEILTKEYESVDHPVIKQLLLSHLDDPIYENGDSVVDAQRLQSDSVVDSKRLQSVHHLKDENSDSVEDAKQLQSVCGEAGEFDSTSFDQAYAPVDDATRNQDASTYSAQQVFNKILSVVGKRCSDSTQQDIESPAKKHRGDISVYQPGPPVELTSSGTRSRADHPRSSSGITNTCTGSHDPKQVCSVNTLAGQALVFNLLESVYDMSDIRDKLMVCKSDAKKYVTTINRYHERTAANILRRRARQGDIIASLLMDNNVHMDILARYQSFLCEPTTHEEAMNTPDYDKWKAAEQSEIQSLIRNKVFKEVNRPKNRKLIPCKWIYRRKKSRQGTVEKFKARLVAKGFHQIFGQDFNETFSPVARLTTIRLLYSIAVLMNLKITQLDVETAFLNAELPEDEQVFVEPPPLMQLPVGKCYRLQRSLYGLKQSPRLWNNTINKFLLEIGFRRLTTDPCIYVKGTPNNAQSYTIISLYVDDLILMSNENTAIDKVVSQLRQRFSMKDFGGLDHILGTEVLTDDQAIYVSQRNYTVQLLTKHGYLDNKYFTPRNVPLSPAIKLSSDMSPSTDAERKFMEDNDRAQKFREILGALLWLAINTRPDIMYAVNQLSKYNNNPGPVHWHAMEYVLRYLKGTVDYGLRFSKTNINPEHSSQLFGINSSTFKGSNTTPNIMEPVIASDADFSRDTDTSKSVSGYVFMLGGAPISWQSTTQSTVALSSMESEYIAACSAAQEAMWLKYLLEELGFGCVKPLIIQEDNKSTIDFADHPGHHRKTKHINRRFHYLREQVQEGNIRLKYCKGEDNVADIFTKPLYPDVFLRHRDKLVTRIPTRI